MASKLKAVAPKAAEPSRPKVLIFGREGIGKTWFSLQFPSVYFIDTEGGANRDHYTDLLEKAGGVYLGPEQGSDTEAHKRVLRPRRLKPGDGKVDAVFVALPDDLGQDLRRSEIDLDDAGRLKYEQPYFSR